MDTLPVKVRVDGRDVQCEARRSGQHWVLRCLEQPDVTEAAASVALAKSKMERRLAAPART